MDYETWNAHTTELQNKHGYTGKPKKGSFAEVSVYEFINDYLPQQLAWQIFSYAIEPNRSNKEIRDHYEGKGQRVWGWTPEAAEGWREGLNWKLSWNVRDEWYPFLEHRFVKTNYFNTNKIVDFLTKVRKHPGILRGYGWYVAEAQCSLMVNKVKGRTKLIKDYRKRFKPDPQMREAHVDLLRADLRVWAEQDPDYYTTSHRADMIAACQRLFDAQEEDQYDNDKALAAVAMCHAIQAI